LRRRKQLFRIDLLLMFKPEGVGVTFTKEYLIAYLLFELITLIEQYRENPGVERRKRGWCDWRK
jgi:hypothetical protein